MTATMNAPVARHARGAGHGNRGADRQLPPPRNDSIVLGPYAEAVHVARLRTRAILAEWGLGQLADDAILVVSELVTNAVQAHWREGLDAPVTLTLLGGSKAVLIVVGDAASGMPSPASPGENDGHGRGLLIVNALAARWDTQPRPGGGKVIRALLLGEQTNPEGHSSHG